MLCHLPDSFNKGHCVATKECKSIDFSGSLISPDAFDDFTKRRESCSAFGTNLVCCEITMYTPQFVPVTMMSSNSTSEATTVSVTTTTSIETTTSKLENTTVEVITKSEFDDIADHKNLKLFNSKTCGKSISYFPGKIF